MDIVIHLQSALAGADEARVSLAWAWAVRLSVSDDTRCPIITYMQGEDGEEADVVWHEDDKDEEPGCLERVAACARQALGARLRAATVRQSCGTVELRIDGACAWRLIACLVDNTRASRISSASMRIGYRLPDHLPPAWELAPRIVSARCGERVWALSPVPATRRASGRVAADRAVSPVSSPSLLWVTIRCSEASLPPAAPPGIAGDGVSASPPRMTLRKRNRHVLSEQQIAEMIERPRPTPSRRPPRS